MLLFILLFHLSYADQYGTDRKSQERRNNKEDCMKVSVTSKVLMFTAGFITHTPYA